MWQTGHALGIEGLRRDRDRDREKGESGVTDDEASDTNSLGIFTQLQYSQCSTYLNHQGTDRW